MRRLLDLFKNDQGATAVEYGLILAMVFLAMVGAVNLFATTTIDMWDNVSNEVRGG
ncbi:Flp family type IVb pilin [Sphingosinicella terrae]|uniref:Flp family type IVb pilin n=1 Tax=Sphingosinicella terrae TaxID=2172047 RepID=UPI000E0D5965|nr:Flp family type IVb pilin [Sphingosinicella terrae]